MKIHYLSLYSNWELTTGGQIYDHKLLTCLDKFDGIETLRIGIELSNSGSFLFFTPLLYPFKIFKVTPCDIAVFNSSYFMRFMLVPLFFKFLKKGKMVGIHHHFMHEQFKGLKRKIYRFFEWKFLKQMDSIILASPYVFDLVAQKINSNKLKLLQIPFDPTPLYSPNPIKGHLTFMGTVEYRKGLKFLIESLIKLKQRGQNYPLTIIGRIIETQYYESLKKSIEEHKLNVRFTGFLGKDEKEKILSETDVFVFPSLLEGYGMALVEAQVYGIPVVSFDNSAMPYNVKNDINGYTVKNEDTTEFANAIEKIVENRDLRERLSKGAFDNLKNQNTQEKFEEDIINYFSCL